MLSRLILGILLLAAVVVGFQTYRRLDEQEQLSRRLRAQGLSAAAALARAEDAHAALKKQLATAREDQLRLEQELQAELGRRQGINGRLEELAAKMRADRERYNKEIWADKKFMPDGLQVALQTVHECLAADGYPGIRFLGAKSLEERELRRVQMLERDPGAFTSQLYVAARVVFELDRALGRLRLRFYDGFRRGPTGREAFPEEGHLLELVEVDGRNWEQRLPFLVRAEGAYPQAKGEATVRRMAPRLKASWRARLNELLALAKTHRVLKLESFRSLHQASFEEALLLGYDQGKVLQMSVEAARIAVLVFPKDGLVELCCFEGTLREKGGEITIPAAGHRILLRGVTPQKAREVMLGMVIDP